MIPPILLIQFIEYRRFAMIFIEVELTSRIRLG